MLAIYCRTSKSKEGGTDYSIENQQSGGIKLSGKLGLPYQLYIDEGLSGTLDETDRPAFGEMMLAIKNRKISAVYCIDQSRIERNSKVWDFFSIECINHGCSYYPNGIEFNLKDDQNMLVAGIMSLVNTQYTKLTSKKVKEANNSKAKLGKTHGLKAYGYKRNETNNYEIVEDEAKYVRRMFELSLKGVGVYTIAKEFNSEGVPTKFNQYKGTLTRKDDYTKKETYYEKSKVKWRGNVIYDMLKNPIYKGVRIWNKGKEDEIEANIGTQIIESELWQKVNENLKKNKKNAGRKETYNYLLNGLVWCGHCGKEVVGKKRPKGNDNSYKCKGKRPPNHDCPNSRAISLPKFETFVIHHLFKSKGLKNLLELSPKDYSEAKRLATLLEEKKSALEKSEKRLARLAKLLQDPDLEEDLTFVEDYKSCRESKSTLTDEIQELQMRLADAQNEARNERSKTIIESYSEDVGFDRLKKLVHALVERIELYHTKETKSGFFLIRIHYGNYVEVSLFYTNWQAMKWNWLSRYRATAVTDEELTQDREDSIELLKYLGYGNLNSQKLQEIERGINEDRVKRNLPILTQEELNKTNPFSESYQGQESSESMHEIIVLKKSELFNFE